MLPGIKSDKQINDWGAAIATYGGKDQAQGEKRKEAASAREEIEAKIEQLAGLRRQIQLAADQAWPWRTNGVATIRKAFLLPTDRPLV
ncbi:MAG: hypothetical protein HY674_01060 [Chloroflexi bacterium]|nr:hypothetical protein [Chloroflexota bacterium]